MMYLFVKNANLDLVLRSLISSSLRFKVSVAHHKCEMPADGPLAAVDAIKGQIEASQGMIKSVWLVGGFAASPWLFTQLLERLAPFKIVVSRPDTQTCVYHLTPLPLTCD